MKEKHPYTLQPGSVLRSSKHEYRVESVLGMGGFGITYLAVATLKDGNMEHNVRYAVKEFFMSSICTRDAQGRVEVNPLQQATFDHRKADFRQEARSLHHLPAHEGIVRVNEVFDDNNTSYFVMEYLGHDTLWKTVRESQTQCLSEQQALSLFIPVCMAVRFLHQHRRLHLDIKPENIMMVNGQPKMIDFGSSILFKMNGKPSHSQAITCSDRYAPPEQYHGVESFAPTLDIYALGATLFYLLTGHESVESKEISESYIETALPDEVGSHTRSLLKKCLQPEAALRFASVDDLLEFLSPDLLGREKGSHETRLISEGRQRRSILSLKTLRLAILLIGLVAVVVFGWVALRHGFGGTSPFGPSPLSDTLSGVDSVAEVLPQPSEPEEEKEAVRPQPIEVVPQPEPAPASDGTPKSNSSVGTLHLSYGEWEGGIRNGKPHGNGTLTFTTRRLIDSRLGSEYMAESGDQLREAVFQNGRLISALWHRSGADDEFIMVGD